MSCARVVCPHCLGVHAPDAVCVVWSTFAVRDEDVIERLRELPFPHYEALALALAAYLREFASSGYDSSDFPDFVAAQIRRARGL